jgi:hypothetical protein
MAMPGIRHDRRTYHHGYERGAETGLSAENVPITQKSIASHRGFLHLASKNHRALRDGDFRLRALKRELVITLRVLGFPASTEQTTRPIALFNSSPSSRRCLAGSSPWIVKSCNPRSSQRQSSNGQIEVAMTTALGYGGLGHMFRQGVLILTIAALFAWIAHGLADTIPAPGAPQTGTLTGVVVDQEGRPLAAASVWALARQDKFGPTQCGADGRFRLPELPIDKPLTIWAEAPGLARGRCDDIRTFPGKARDIGRLILLPGTRVIGRLVDVQGKPVANVGAKLEVFRHQLGHTIMSQGTEWAFSADHDGRFDTPPLPAGTANFCFSAAGKVRTFVSKNAEPGTAVIDLGDVTLPDELPVGGVVVDQEGNPAPGVEVIADYDWDNPAKTDKGGHFTVHGAGKKLKTLQLQSNDYFSPEPFNVSPGRTDLKLTVIKAYEIHGTAVDAETGKLVPIDTVRLCRVERDPKDGHVTLVG